MALCDTPPAEPQRHLYRGAATAPRRRHVGPVYASPRRAPSLAPPGRARPLRGRLELLHNAFLIHDDVEDESDQRRGRPTLHALYGIPIAVNVGDALTLVALRALIDNRDTLGPRLTLRIMEETERMARESVEGQAIELGCGADNTLTLSDSDYLDCGAEKTCSSPRSGLSAVGALIGHADRPRSRPPGPFGFFSATRFRYQDDVLNRRG